MAVNNKQGPEAGSVTPAEERLRAACRGLEREMYRRGRHHREVARAHDVTIESVVWLMKQAGIGFHGHEPGAPPEDLDAAVAALQPGWSFRPAGGGHGP